MDLNRNAKLEALITIMDANLEDILVKAYEKYDAPMVLFTYGQGSVKSKIYEILGYGGPKKIVSFSIQTKKISSLLMDKLHADIDLLRPGTGIAFSISLSSVSKTLAELCVKSGEKHEIGSEGMIVTSKAPYHLIIAIVNSGHFAMVMEAAKSAGAQGGTLIHARSIGSKRAFKYMGITVQPEKDLVLILSKDENRLSIMNEITSKAGLHTDAAGFCFSLPANDVVGIDAAIDNFDEHNNL